MTLKNDPSECMALPTQLPFQGLTGKICESKESPKIHKKNTVCFQVCFLRKFVASTKKSLRNQAAKIHPKHLQGALEGRACRQPKRWMDGRGHLQKKTTQTSCKNYYEVTPNPNFMRYYEVLSIHSSCIIMRYYQRKQ